jgi:hypothetical protein
MRARTTQRVPIRRPRKAYPNHDPESVVEAIAHTILFVFTLFVGIIGLLFIADGLWSRRRGHTPYCRHCNYNLTSLDSDRCPECGMATATELSVNHDKARTAPAGPAIVAGGEAKRSPRLEGR